MNSSQELRDKIRDPNCERCPLHGQAQHVCLIGDGAVPASIFLVGEAPGKREDQVHKPFQGRSGQLLDSVLDAFSLNRNDIFISNAVHCRPEDNETPSLSDTEVCSSKFLRREIFHVKPKLLIALGKIAAYALTGDNSSIQTRRQQVFRTAKPYLEDIPIVITYHPAAALRNDYLVEKIVEDFEFAMDVLNGKFKTPDELQHIQLDSIWDIPGIKEAKVVALDLETDGFDPYLVGRDIISVQIAIDPNTGYYIRYNPTVKEELKELFKDPKKIFRNHNIPFDLRWLLEKAGIKLPKGSQLRDTLIETHLLDENALAKDLDTVSSEVLGIPPHKNSVKDYVKKNKCSWRDVPLEIAVPYGCDDVIKPYRLGKVFIPRLKEQGLMPLYRLQMRSLELVTRMQRSGFKVDVARIDEMADIYEGLVSDTDDWFKGFLGFPINVNSPKQVNELLYSKWNLPALGRPGYWKDPPTKDTREETVLSLIASESTNSDQKVFLHTLLEQREQRKILNHYVLGLGDWIRDGDLVHAVFKLFGTVTGRPSCTEPNLQQIPRDGDVKSLFISRYGDDGILMQIDMSQAELRLGAHYSGERTMIKYFREGGDIHIKMAGKVFKIPVEDVSPKQRKKTKTVNFGVMYGSSEYTMCVPMECSANEAREFIKMWKNEFYDWPPYEKKMRALVLEQGYVESIFKRRRRLPIMDPTTKQGKESIRQAINAPIQGGVGDLNLLCGVNSYDRIKAEGIKKVHFVNMVHDCWVIDTLKSNVQDLARIFRQEFRKPNFGEFNIELQVPMDVEIQVGTNWKNLKVLEE